MFKSKFSISFFLVIFTFLTFSSVFAQATNNDALPKTQNKINKWEGINGKNNEFYVVVPEGYQTFADGDFFFKKESGGQVKVASHRTLVRYINGVVSMLELYEGDVKDIQPLLAGRQKGELTKDESIDGFECKFYIEKTPQYIWRRQYYSIKNRLYVLQAVSRTENNQIVSNFLESVRLTNQNQIVTPNLDKDAKPVALAEITEVIPDKLDDSQVYSGKTDRNIIILYKPRPQYSPEARRSGASGVVKLKVLFSSSGKTTKFEVISGSPRELSEAAIKAAEQIKFLPAEKDGKLVSVYKTLEYSFSTY